MLKDCLVLLIPTINETRIFINEDKTLSLYNIPQKYYKNGYELYILSNDKITESFEGVVVDIDECCLRNAKSDLETLQFCRKIIATTNLESNLALIPERFIKKYCKFNGKIKNVFVDYENDDTLKLSENTISISLQSSYTTEELLFMVEIWKDTQEFSNLKFGKIDPQTFDMWLLENI